MAASPWPLVALNVIQASFELADHAHSRAVFNARLPLPPDAGISGGVLVMDTAHRSGVGALTLVVALPPQPVNRAQKRTGQSCREGMRAPHMFVRAGRRAAH